jgi:hypothetical protein
LIIQKTNTPSINYYQLLLFFYSVFPRAGTLAWPDPVLAVLNFKRRAEPNLSGTISPKYWSKKLFSTL